METLIISTVVSAMVSCLVALFFGPWLMVRQEAAKQDMIVRRDIIRLLERTKLYLENELLERQRLRDGGSRSSPEINIYTVGKFLWPIVRKLDDPDLRTKSGKRLKREISRVGGNGLYKWLRLREREPEGPTWEDAERAMYLQLSASAPHKTTPLDALVASKTTNDLEPVKLVLNEIQRLERHLEGRGIKGLWG